MPDAATMAGGALPTIAYLAPELPALSATFVYEELLALERRGLRIVPFSVRAAASPATAQSALAQRTQLLYAGSKPALLLRSLAHLPSFGGRGGAALGQLWSDMLATGLHRAQSWKLAWQFLASVELATKLKAQGCRHLHVHFAHTPTQIAMYASTLSGIPFTLTAHANDIFERGLLLDRKATRAKRFLTISDFNRRHLERVGVAPQRLAVVRCGVSFEAGPSRTQRAIDASTPLRVGSLGRMVEKKGFDVLIKAVASLHSAGRPVELRIAGDGPLRDELQALVAQLGIATITHFDGSLPHTRVAGWMRELDVFVLACKKDKQGDMDGIPVVLMEAMSQYVPVISTRISGIPELVVHEETGLLADPDDAVDLARQLERMIDSVPLRERLAAAACPHVMHEFGQSSNLDRLLGHFDLQHA